ncbi:MAG: phytase [Acidimicrobiales bacterium]
MTSSKCRVVASATADGCDRTDGLEAVVGNFGPQFPYGSFVCQDNANLAPHPGNMNFKLVRLESIIPEVMTLTTPTPPTTQPRPEPQQPPTTGARGGSWMLGVEGTVFAFGDAGTHGEPAGRAGITAVDLEPTPSGDGYWILDDRGDISAHGDATFHGAPSEGTRIGPRRWEQTALPVPSC